jgi:hypothetical protein
MIYIFVIFITFTIEKEEDLPLSKMYSVFNSWFLYGLMTGPWAKTWMPVYALKRKVLVVIVWLISGKGIQ